MTWLLTALSIAAVLVLGTVGLRAESARVEYPPALDVERLLSAIAMVENWRKVSVSPTGAVGPYQMKPSAGDGSKEAAFRHARWILATLKSHGYAPTVYSFALCWKAGFDAFAANGFTAADSDYAERVRNVFYDR